MQELAGRFAALDPEAAAALHVIGYFDTLVDGHVGLETLVRGAAVLSGFPSRLVDADRRLDLRVQPDGRAVAAPQAPEAGWRSLVVLEGELTTVWLETAEHRALDDLVLERLASGVRVVLDRTRGRVVRDDEAAIEVLLDAASPEASRARAAQRLGLPAEGRIRVLALLPDAVSRLPELHGVRVSIERESAAGAVRPPGRCGSGGFVGVLDAPRSWDEARAALRFTAAGTQADPGPRTVDHASLGGLAVLAAGVSERTPPVSDVIDLERVALDAPWVLETLDQVASHASVRAASLAAHVHHSTLQVRVQQVEALLGWSVSDPSGRLRLQLALALRRLHRNP